MKKYLILLLLALPVFAQDDSVETHQLKNRVFDVHNRAPNEIANAILLLGSGSKGAAMSVNEQLRTITVRDFPENIAAIETAIKRLDQAEIAPIISLDISVLIGSKTPVPTAEPIPDDLAPVIKQLRKTLRFSHYGVITSMIHRTKPGAGIENSGVMDSALIRTTTKDARAIPYSYNFSGITTSGNVTNVNEFRFGMRIPLDYGTLGIKYDNVGFKTPVSIRQNEKVVIGTATMGDKALIVVVTATVEQ